MDYNLQVDVDVDTSTIPPTVTMNFYTVSNVQQSVFDDMFGGRLVVYTPIDGLSFGVSAYTGKHYEKHDGVAVDVENAKRHEVYGLFVEYLTESLSVRSEYRNMSKANGEGVEIESAYLEGAYRFMEHWQVAAIWDYSNLDLGPFAGYVPDSLSSLLEHESWAVGLNYWFSPNFVLKCSYHWIDGNFHAAPTTDYAEVLLSGEIDESTEMFLVGAQFSF